MKEASHKSHITGGHLCKMPRIGKLTEVERTGEATGSDLNGVRVCVWGDGNVLELDKDGCTQHCEYTKRY